MSQKTSMQVDPVMGILCAFCGFLLVFAVAGCVGSVMASIEKQRALEADQCELIASTKTGKSIYCGKACFRPELRKEYQCKSGIKVVIE